MNISVFVWSMMTEEKDVLDKILQFLNSKTKKDLIFNVLDLRTVEDSEENYNHPMIVFGSNAAAFMEYLPNSLRFDTYELAGLLPKEGNKKRRTAALKKIEEIANWLDDYEENNNWEKKVELPNKATVSSDSGVGDIQITEQEAESLLKIKELLNGSKIVLTKGDIVIEVQ